MICFIHSYKSASFKKVKEYKLKPDLFPSKENTRANICSTKPSHNKQTSKNTNIQIIEGKNINSKYTAPELTRYIQNRNCIVNVFLVYVCLEK